MYLQKDSESDPDDITEAASHFPLFNENVKTEMIDYSLSQEIPKMETVPSMLFEETQEGHDQTGNSPLPSEILFNGMPESMNIVNDLSNVSKSNDEESKMDTTQITCEYEQEVSNNLEEKPLLDDCEMKPNLEEGEINVEMGNIEVSEELDKKKEVAAEIKQDECNESIVNDIDTKVLEENGSSLGERNNEVSAIPEMDDLNIDKEENLLEQS